MGRLVSTSCVAMIILWNNLEPGKIWDPVARWAPLYRGTPFYPILSKPAMQSLINFFSICGFVASGLTALRSSLVQ